MEPTVCFVSASNQNVFFGELLAALGDALASRGVAVEYAVDYFPDLRDELVYVFIPHELMPFLMTDAHPSAAQLRRSVVICTEQPGTHWFEETAQVAERAAATVDINRLGVAALRKRNVDARSLQLGYAPGWDRWHGEPDSQRPIELAFFGGVTSRRLTALGRCARQLAGRRTELHLPEALVPHQAGSELFLSGGRKWDMLQRSKVLMNVHRGELPYFEWQRAIEAMINGCVVLSEHSLGFEPLLPGQHFVSVSFDSLDVALEALLDDEERIAQMRKSAYDFLRDEYPLSTSIEALADAASDASRSRIPARASGAGMPEPKPKLPSVPLPEYERLVQHQANFDPLHTITEGEAHVTCSETTRARRAESLGTVERLDPSIGVTHGGTPHVSVVVVVDSGESSVEPTIEGLAISNFTDYELVIVDDGSTEQSTAAIHSALRRMPWVAARLITRSHSEGLAQARNIASQTAGGDLLLMLNARTVPYPQAVGRLVEALDRTPAAAFAYGILERQGFDGDVGLMNYLGWDANRLRYGNFIENMAMIRRSALAEVGGYISDTRLDGWEDFALWCAFAERRWKGVRIPEILASHRRTTPKTGLFAEADQGAAWTLLLERFTCLFASTA